MIMNKQILVSDITIKLADGGTSPSLSFRQKIELSKLMDRLGVNVIELGQIKGGKQESLLIKSISSAVKNSVLAVPVDIFNPESVVFASDSLQEASHPRLQVRVPVSTVQMEYLCHCKPVRIQELVADNVSRCAAVCRDVEFIAEDFSRSDEDFLMQVIRAAVENGATVVTLHDTAGTLFDHEYYDATKKIRNILPENVKLGIWCSNEMYMADSCAIAAVRAGADEIKTALYDESTTSLSRFIKILNVKSNVCKASSTVAVTEIQRVVSQIKALYEADKKAPFASMSGTTDGNEELQLTVHDDLETVVKAAGKLGYELGEEDGRNVYAAFMSLASKTEVVKAKELEAIVASVAFQAPPTYRLERYLVNTGNVITSTCHLILRKGDDLIEDVCMGGGPIDASFLAIEKLVGRRYELDDFQIQSVTQGSKSMGGAVVRLRKGDKVYSGRGISRDIVEASIFAYLSAINKIVYEEGEA